MARKGMGRGQGKGFKNIIGLDPKTHSNSARGIKQPQKLSPRVQNMLKKNPSLENKSFKELQKKGVFLKFQADSDGDGVVNIKDCKPLDPKKQDFKQTFAKVKVFGKKIAKEGIELGKKGLKKLADIEREKKVQALKEIKHPKVMKLEKQEARVKELRTQVQTEDDSSEREKIDSELDREEEQLREIQEEVTEIKVEDLSDRELKTLAIRHKGGDFAIFGSGNQFKDELLRRIKSRGEISREEARINNELNIEKEKLKKELAEARKEAREDEGGLFGL